MKPRGVKNSDSATEMTHTPDTLVGRVGRLLSSRRTRLPGLSVTRSNRGVRPSTRGSVCVRMMTAENLAGGLQAAGIHRLYGRGAGSRGGFGPCLAGVALAGRQDPDVAGRCSPAPGRAARIAGWRGDHTNRARSGNAERQTGALWQAGARAAGSKRALALRPGGPWSSFEQQQWHQWRERTGLP